MEYNESNISVNLKGTKTEIEKASNWFKKLISGDKEWEEESITQGAYLKKIYDVCSELGYTNVLSLTLNEEEVYSGDSNGESFEKAMKLAFKEEELKDYTVEISLDTNGDEEENILITMESKHDVDSYPLKIQVCDVEGHEEKLEALGKKIEEHFETEEVEIDADENSEVEDEEGSEEVEEDSKDDSETEETEEKTTA